MQAAWSEELRTRLVRLVEAELDRVVAEADREGTRLAWKEDGPLCWTIDVLWGPNTGYYELRAAPGTGFLVTHSNRRVGIHGLHHSLSIATIIPFVVVEWSIFDPDGSPEMLAFLARQRHPLARLVAHVMAAHPSNVESPT